MGQSDRTCEQTHIYEPGLSGPRFFKESSHFFANLQMVSIDSGRLHKISIFAAGTLGRRGRPQLQAWHNFSITAAVARYG